MRLSDGVLREFATRGFILIRDAIPAAALAAASEAIDSLVEGQPPPDGHVGHHFYWLPLDDGPVSALFLETPLRLLAGSLVEPGEIEVAFDQVQVALNIPPFSHRPGRHHLDGYLEGEEEPASFTLLAGVLLSDQLVENAGNLWVWPGTHRTHAEYFRAHGPEALVATRGYPEIELPEPVQVVGRAGDLVLAHYMLGHNIGGNYESDEVRRAVYFRLRRVGHRASWREALCDELFEFDAVRSVLGVDAE